jgi:hypothetical protein
VEGSQLPIAIYTAVAHGLNGYNAPILRNQIKFNDEPLPHDPADQPIPVGKDSHDLFVALRGHIGEKRSSYHLFHIVAKKSRNGRAHPGKTKVGIDFPDNVGEALDGKPQLRRFFSLNCLQLLQLGNPLPHGRKFCDEFIIGLTADFHLHPPNIMPVPYPVDQENPVFRAPYSYRRWDSNRYFSMTALNWLRLNGLVR